MLLSFDHILIFEYKRHLVALLVFPLSAIYWLLEGLLDDTPTDQSEKWADKMFW